jgi:hypothetical protein
MEAQQEQRVLMRGSGEAGALSLLGVAHVLPPTIYSCMSNQACIGHTAVVLNLSIV